MKSIRNYPKSERVFFEDKKDDIKYLDYCMNCSKECKQSHKARMVKCPNKDIVHTPKEYIKEIDKAKKSVDTIGKEIGLTNKLVKDMLYEIEDMSFIVYDKLDKLLFPNSKRNSK